jgi:phospholipase/carboxylesterase
MNRLATLSEDTLTNLDQLSPSNGLTADQGPLRQLATGEVVDHAVFVPMHYEQRYSYPLVVWLHGPSGNEQQLQQVMPIVSLRNFVAVAPRGTVLEENSVNAFSWKQSPAHIELAEDRVFDCIDIAKRQFNIPNERIFLAGYGCGGTMAVRIAWNHPDRFKGAATIGGSLPECHRPLHHVNRLRQLPLLLACGQNASVFDQQLVCDNLRLLHSAGMTVALRQYPCADDLRTTMLNDLNNWVMSIVCEKT